MTLNKEDPVSLSARASFTSNLTLHFFRTGLDPSVMHEIEVLNTGSSDAGADAGSLLVLSAMNVTNIEPPGCVQFAFSAIPRTAEG